MMWDTQSFPHVRLHCERVINDSHQDDHDNNHDHHKPCIRFSLHPNSTHSETWSKPPHTEAAGHAKTTIAGPTVELDLADFLVDRHTEIMELMCALEVDTDTKCDIVEKIIVQAEKSIANMRGLFQVGEEKFHLKVLVKLYVSTHHMLVIDSSVA